MNDSEYKLVHIDNGIGWCEDQYGNTMDIPITHITDDGIEFNIDSTCIIKDLMQEHNVIVVSKQNQVLAICLEQTDTGYEINNVYLLKITESHILH